MAAKKGRALIVKFDDTATGALVAIEGARNGSISFGNETVDITNKDDESSLGFLHRRLLEQAGVTSITITVDGVFTDTATQEKMFEAARKNTHPRLSIVIPGTSGGVYSGSFAVASADASGAYNNEIAWSGTFESAGEIAYTPST
jgi:TP901-1 family phage major tail protein